MPFAVACRCGQRFMADDYLDGRQVNCPMCGQSLVVQRPQPRFRPNAAPQVVSCRCGLAFQAAPHLAGTRVACPSCRSPIDVPAAPLPIQGSTAASSTMGTHTSVARPSAGGIGLPKRKANDRLPLIVAGAVLAVLAISGVGIAVHSFLTHRSAQVAQHDESTATAPTEEKSPADRLNVPFSKRGLPTAAAPPSGPTIPFQNLTLNDGRTGNPAPITTNASPNQSSSSGPFNTSSSSTLSASPSRFADLTGSSVASLPIKPAETKSDGWQEKTLPDGSISVEVPRGVSEARNTIKLPAGAQALQLQDATESTLFMVMSLQLPDELPTDKVQSFLRESADKIPLPLPNLQGQTEITHRGFPGLERTQTGIVNGTGMKAVTRLILVRDTLIVLSSAATQDGFDRQIAERFLNSMRLSSDQQAGYLEQGMTRWYSSAANLRGARASSASEDMVELKYSWLTELLPHLGRQRLYDRIQFNDPWTDDKNVPVASTTVSEFLNPADRRDKYRGLQFEGLAVTHFVGVSGVEDKRNVIAARLLRSDPRAGIFGYDEVVPTAAITDGLSHTMMMVGSGELIGPWIVGGGSTIRGAREPHFDRLSGFGTQGGSQRGTLAVMADGSVRFVAATTDGKVFRAMCTTHAGESFDLENVAPRSVLRQVEDQQ